MQQGRRTFLKLAGTSTLASVGAAMGVLPLYEQAFAQTGQNLAPTLAAPPPSSPATMITDGQYFDAQKLQAYAKELAKKPFVPLNTILPDALTNLSYEQFVGITAKPDSRIWGNQANGFSLELLHRGFIFNAPMDIFTVEDGTAHRQAYRADMFDFGKLASALPANFQTSTPDIGFSGFRLFQNRDGQKTEIAIFQGASFFRAIAYGQNEGVMARALSLRTADSKGEEFPIFRAMVIEQPSYSDVLVLHALLDSESLTGYYRMSVRPGDVTILDTECTLYPRVDLDHIGLAPMTATCLYNGLDRRKSEDLRPGVFEVSGLAMLSGANEWLWRPVANRTTLQVSAFLDQNPHGFGLLQRSRNFYTFEDDEQHWERRPSLWIEPIGDWGAGTVQLVEIPSESEVAQNINAYWRPKAMLTANSEASFAYRQNWCWAAPQRPQLATVTASRSGKAGKRRRFVVEFSGQNLADIAVDDEIKPMLNANPGSFVNLRLYRMNEHKIARVLFDLDPSAETYSELRLVLMQNDKPLSETWLYRWTP